MGTSRFLQLGDLPTPFQIDIKAPFHPRYRQRHRYAAVNVILTTPLLVFVTPSEQ